MDCVFLGFGGQTPGVGVLTADGGGCQRRTTLKAGQSVYALDVQAGTDWVAYGTRTGDLHACQWLPEGQPHPPSCQWLQGAPILAVCWINDARLCSSDTAGRCLLWSTAAADHPERLDTEGRIICSLLKLPNGELAGLSQDGYLLFWSLSTGRLLRCIGGASPPEKLALVHLRFWHREGLVLHPARDGRLCMLAPDQTRCRYVEAHQGPFYVVLPGPQGVLTVGHEERRARMWDPLRGAPQWEAEAPWSHPIVSGWLVGHPAGAIVLIDREGTAALFEYADGGVRLIRSLAGTDCRVVAGLPWEEQQRRSHARRVAQVIQLQAQAKEAIRGGHAEKVKRLADEMTSLGFQRLALGVRAQQARQENRLLDELRLRRELIGLLGHDPRSETSVRQYVLLLKSLWQLSEAWSVHRAWGGAGDDHEWLANAVNRLACGRSVVEADVPLLLIAEAATVLGRTLSGMWVITSSEPLNLPPQCSLEAFLARYEQVRRANRGPVAVAPAGCETVWWVARDRIEQVPLIDLSICCEDNGGHVRIALRFEQCNGLRNVKPVLLLDADGLGRDTSVTPGNHELLSVLEGSETLQGISARPWEIQRLVTEALRRLWTESQWRRNQGKGTDHEP